MKISYVLSGGGAKGSFQVGVMKKLHEQGIVPDAIYGTSVGALNAFGYAYAGMSGLEQHWLDIVGPKWYSPWTPSSDVLSFNWSILLLGWADGIYNTKPLKKYLENLAITSPICEAIAVKANLNSGIVEYVSNKNVPVSDFTEAVRASGSIPGMMSPVGDWVDGGVRKFVPLEKAITDGADKIYVILTCPLTQNALDSYDTSSQFPLFKFFNIAYRAIDGVMEQEIFTTNAEDCFNNDSNIPIEVYAPLVVPCTTFDFNPAKIRANIEMGYNAQVIEKLPV